MIADFSVWLCCTDQNSIAKNRELLALVICFEWSRCYLECTTFEIFADSQVVKPFFSKQNLTRMEIKWLKMFGFSEQDCYWRKCC